MRPAAAPGGGAEVDVAVALGADLFALLGAALAPFDLPQLAGVRLEAIRLPASFAGAFRAGPKFGIAGTRRLTGVHGRPIIGTIIKPSVGLSPRADGRASCAQLAAPGIDFIKDDELMADPPHSPFDQRVDAVMRVINDHADRTGKKVMYAFNVSDEIDAMRGTTTRSSPTRRHRVMVSLNSVGLAGVKKLRDRGSCPIHGHRNGWGMLNRHPLLGIDVPRRIRSSGGWRASTRSTSTASPTSSGRTTTRSSARSRRA